jgi:formate dehydrogenase subunit delta
MDMKNLIHMANQIGEFFEAMPDRDDALMGIVGHMHNFWAPRMRIQLLEYIDAQNGQGLKPIVIFAIHSHRDKLLPQHAESTAS